MQYLEDVVPRILGKHTKFVTFFVSTIDEIPAIFSNLGPRAQSKLAHAYYVILLWVARAGNYGSCMQYLGDVMRVMNTTTMIQCAKGPEGE